MCTAEEKLSFVYNQYYLHQDEASTACDFDGTAETQSGSTDGDCSELLSATGTAGAADVTAVPTGFGSSSQPSSTASSSVAAMGSVIIPRFRMGLLSLGAYLTVAVRVYLYCRILLLLWFSFSFLLSGPVFSRGLL